MVLCSSTHFKYIIHDGTACIVQLGFMLVVVVDTPHNWLLSWSLMYATEECHGYFIDYEELSDTVVHT